MKPFNLKEYLKNPNRKIVTRDGVAVRIICTDFDREYPIVGAIKEHTFPTLFTEKGCYNSDGTSSPCDLFFAPEKKEKKEKHEGWVNLYLDANYNSHTPGACIYKSKKSAEKEGKSCKNYITTAKIEWEEQLWIHQNF